MTLTCDFDPRHGDGRHCDACQLVKCDPCWDRGGVGGEWACGECLASQAIADAEAREGTRPRAARLNENSRCGIHGEPTYLTGRCYTCDLTASLARKANA